MAEIVGFTASLITLAGVGAKLACTLRDVTSILRSAEYDAGLIAADISVFACSLTQLSKITSDRDIPEAERLFEIVEVLTPACSALIQEMQNLIGDPVDFRFKNPFWMRALRYRFRWLVQGPKIAFVKGLIESFKLTLVFLVSTMDLAVVLKQDAQHEIKESLKTQVRSSLRFAEDAKENLLRFAEPEPIGQPPALLDNSNEQEIQTNVSSTEVSLLDQASDSLVLHQDAKSNENDDLKLSRFELEEGGHEKLSLSICHQNLSLIFSIQEKTVNFAEDLLKITPQQTWSWGSARKTENISQAMAMRMHLTERKQHPILPDPPQQGRVQDPAVTQPDKVTHLNHDQDSPDQNSLQTEQVTSDLVEMFKRFLQEERFRSESKVYGETPEDTPVLAHPGPPTEPRNQSPYTMPFMSPGFRGKMSFVNPESPLETPFGQSEQSREQFSEPYSPPAGQTREDALLSRLELLLSGQADQAAKNAQDSSFSRLESLLQAQQEALLRKEAENKKLAEEAKKKDEEDKLGRLERLIIEKDEQIRRDFQDAEAVRQAVKDEADAKVAKEAVEKKAAAEAAVKLLDAAKKAREEAEAKAKRELEEMKLEKRAADLAFRKARNDLDAKSAKEQEILKASYKKLLAEQNAMAEELEKTKKLAEQNKALKPAKSKGGRKITFPSHLRARRDAADFERPVNPSSSN